MIKKKTEKLGLNPLPIPINEIELVSSLNFMLMAVTRIKLLRFFIETVSPSLSLTV